MINEVVLMASLQLDILQTFDSILTTEGKTTIILGEFRELEFGNSNQIAKRISITDGVCVGELIDDTLRGIDIFNLSVAGLCLEAIRSSQNILTRGT